MKLRANQRCPIPGHGFRCKCRTDMIDRPERHSKWEQVRPGVRRLRDPNARHPDGYRYRVSKAEMERVLLRKVREQKGLCSICGEDLSDMNDVVPDHIQPKGMGGGFTDDRADNIGAAHSRCNLEKGSRRIQRSGEVNHEK